MKRISWFVVFVMVASIVGVALVSSSGAVVTEGRLTFVAKPVNETGIDIDGDGELDPGDGWVSNAVLLKGGESVGSVVSSCQYVQLRANGLGTLQCVNTAKVPGGQIAVQSRMVEGQSFIPPAAITGGTGAFSTASGYAVTEPIDGSMSVKVTLYLLP
jgi:hypothetical protein